MVSVGSSKRPAGQEMPERGQPRALAPRAFPASVARTVK